MNKKQLTPIVATLLTLISLMAAPAGFAAPSALSPTARSEKETPEPRRQSAPAAVAHPSVKVIDSAGTINDPAWFTKAYNAGFRLYVMHSTAWGTCTPWYNTEAQLGMALAAGLKIAVYTRDPGCWQGGITAAGKHQSKLQFFALDVETGGAVVTRDMVNGVKAMGIRPVIYTGSGMWPSMTSNSKAFSDVPLWDTDTRSINYNRWNANYLSPNPVAYGGWNTSTTMRVGVQQKFNQNLNGVGVDLNSFDATFLK